jgi:hypothetical protein
MDYEYDNARSFRVNDDGERELMANFAAFITEEVRYIDGRTIETWLTIEAETPNTTPEATEPNRLPPITINATDFPSMNWVLPNWGVQAIIRPGSSIRDDLRTAIQLNSKPKVSTIYKHLGWTTDDKGKRMYLHAAGAITGKGNDPSVKTKLPPELARYDLSSDTQPKDAARAVLMLIGLTKPEVSWPLLAATMAPLFGPVDFGIHLAGRTGTFKSEIMSLFQSMYGAGMDARHLPGSWSSTANALEAQAYLCKNAAFVVDDFVPTGTAWQVRSYQQAADKLIRAAGNQAGRARLTDASNLQTTMYPRGIILSTGEDVPEGHSVRARLLILELSPGDIDPKKLSAAQANRSMFPAVTAALCQLLALAPANIDDLAEKIRNENIEVGHSRTPSMIGRLVAVAWEFIAWLEACQWLTKQQANKLRSVSADSIQKAGENQNQYLEEADPADQFGAAVRHVFAAGLGHVRSTNGGVPKGAEQLGWTVEGSGSDIPQYKSRGPCIGWVRWEDNELLLDITAGINIIKKAAGQDWTITKQTMFKRLKDSGLLKRTDDQRQRNTVRVTAEGHPRQALALDLAQILDSQEIPQ